MDMSYIMDSGQNWLYTTFPNIFLLISADPADLSPEQEKSLQKSAIDFACENDVIYNL